MRHPSYFGFYIWCIGSQLLLLNPICIIIYHILLKEFFRDRIQLEEEYLAKFFGLQWNEYTKSTPGLYF